MRAMTSAKLIPAAATAMRTSPAPISGSGRSCTWSTPGPPCLVMTTARIAGATLPDGLGLEPLAEIHRPAVEEALGRHDLLHHRVGHRRIGRHDHRGEALAGLRALLARRGPVRLARRRLARRVVGVSDRGRGDVDAVGAEDGAHPPDHARKVLVAEDDNVWLG